MIETLEAIHIFSSWALSGGEKVTLCLCDYVCGSRDGGIVYKVTSVHQSLASQHFSASSLVTSM